LSPVVVRRRWPAFLLGLAVGLTLASLVAGALLVIRPWETTPAAPGVREQTLAVCIQAVKDSLKSPASAQFSEEAARTNDSGDWLWTGTVDAQNAFGGLLRGHWGCRAYRNGDQWIADNVSVTTG
jgi:hypothetical protein